MVGSRILLALLSIQLVWLSAEVDATTGWLRGPFSCYKFVHEARSQGQAEWSCNLMGGHLLRFEHSDEIAYVKGLRTTHGLTNGYWWIGGRADTQRRWWWTNKDGCSEPHGCPVTTSDWIPGQPDNHNNQPEDCIEMLDNHNGYAMRWNDKSCAESRWYICENRTC